MFKLWGVLKGLLVQNEADRSKELTYEVDDTATTNTKTRLIAKQTSDRTIYLPDGDGTIPVATGTGGKIHNDDIADDADIDWDKLDSGVAGSAVITDALGTLTTEPALATSRGGTGHDLSTHTGVMEVDSGAITIPDQLSTGKGGTGADLSSANGLVQATAGVIEASNDVSGINLNFGVGSSTVQLVVPYLSTTQRDALTNVSAGTIIYHDDEGRAEIYDSRGWSVLAPDVTNELDGIVDGLVYRDNSVTKNSFISVDTSAFDPSLVGNVSLEFTGADEIVFPNVSAESDGMNYITYRSGAQTLTDKKLDGGTASAANTWILPQNSKANLDALTRQEGALYYENVTNKIYYDNGTSLVEVGSGSGSGTDLSSLDDGIVRVDSGTATTTNFKLTNADTSPGEVELAADTSSDVTLNLPNLDTDLVGHNSHQTLTNKKLDGGDASSQNEWKLPSESTTNLTALTRNEGVLAYDTDLDAPVYDDGSAFVRLAKHSDIPADSGGGGGGGVGDNLIVNGAFDVWNRRQSSGLFSMSEDDDDGFISDRWRLFGGSNNLRFKRQDITESDWTNFDICPKYGLRCQPVHNSLITGVGSSNFNFIYQELVPEERGLANHGQNLCLSFYAKSNVAGKFGVTFACGAGDPLNTTVANRTYTIDTADTLQYFKIEDIQVDQPDIKTQLIFWLRQNTTSSASNNNRCVTGSNVGPGTTYTIPGTEFGTFNVAGHNDNYLELYCIKLEVGSEATQYRYKGGSVAAERDECLQHYESYDYGIDSLNDNNVWYDRLPSYSGALADGAVVTYLKYSPKALDPTVDIFDRKFNLDTAHYGSDSETFSVDVNYATRTRCEIVNDNDAAVTISDDIGMGCFWRVHTGY